MNHGEPQADDVPFSEAGAIRTMQIIAAAMIAGVTLFAVIALSLTWGKQPNAELIMSYMAAGFAGILLVLRFVVPALVARSQIQQLLRPDNVSRMDDGEKRRLLYGVYQASMIISFALPEGAAFFCLIAYIVDASSIALGVFAVLWASMVASFPTKARVDDWVRDQLQLLNF